MRSFKQFAMAGISISAWLLSQVVLADAISLKQAEALALEYDARLSMKRAQTQAFIEKSIEADTLPDPRVSLGLLNFPTDTFARDQEPMTQVRVGLQQMFPRGDTLQLNSKKALASSEISKADALNYEAMLRMKVRATFLELVYWLQAEQVVQKNRKYFQQLVKITQSQYASGGRRQQDVIRANLELDMLDDRLDMIATKQQTIRANLAKLIGEKPAKKIQQSIPQLSVIQQQNDIQPILQRHPMILMKDAKVANGQYGIELAKQSYKPAWMLELGYGFRDGTNPNGSDRADFASAMVSFDLPLFTGDKQDRKVAASRLGYQAAMDEREDALRELTSQYQQTHARWKKLSDRLSRFESEIVPQARENSKASLHGYQSRQADFTSLMRAQITELETNLKHLRLKIDFRKTQAKMLYYTGEAS